MTGKAHLSSSPPSTAAAGVMPALRMGALAGALSPAAGLQLDVAFIAGPDSRTPARLGTVEHVELSSEPLVLLAPPDSHLATKARIEWSCLDGLDFIDFHPSWAVRLLNDEAFEARGIHRRVRFMVNDVHTLLDMVQRGLGVAIVPRPIAGAEPDPGLARIRVRHLMDNTSGLSGGTTYTAWRADRNVAVRALRLPQTFWSGPPSLGGVGYP